ncbi:hypothetical protein [Sphingomonas rubra]|uniref:Cell envelope biogenesis protein TolA n=1 Tax=Sphingomonas rubra TaxID=634430 RepID=A0A1I5REF9_9SPHN|nr:hypothetical protein [Sphingomonas rubra]SFP56923.1 hypothetical protein SAMN04488241_103205 [Sphingomonas rubra]
MVRALKVFRTPIGFHDAYVAAPSRKAALAAWGADADLFARGLAEQVTDPALTREPLASPGEVVRKVRGTMAEHLAALPPSTRRPRAKAAETKPSAKPRPTRDDLDAAQAALDKAESDHDAASRELADREAALARERRALDRAHARVVAPLERARDEADARYRAAMDAWRG